MTPDDILDIIIRGSYLLLAVITLISLVRHRDAARLDIALPFFALAIVVAIPVIRTQTGYDAPWLNLVSSLLLLPQPYLFIRLLKHFQKVPPAVEWAAVAGVVLCWGALVVFEAKLPQVVTLAIVAYFVVAELYTVVSFVRGAVLTRGVTRSQLLLIATGSGMFGLIILLAGIGVVLPRLVPSGPVTRIVAVLSAFSYYLGFASPRWLRRIWQRSELYHFLQGLGQIDDIEQRSKALAYLCQTSIEAVGGLMALVALRNGDSTRLTLCDPAGAPSESHLDAGDDSIVAKAWHETKSLASNTPAEFSPHLREQATALDAHTMYAVPLAYSGQVSGLLLVFLRGALFPEDDLEILSMFAMQQARTLRYLDLITTLRTERDLMQALMDNIPDTIYFKDAESRFTRINQAQARVLGIPQPAQAVGRTDMDFQVPELAEEFMKEEREIIRTGTPLINRIEFNPAPDGSPRWFSATKVPLTDPSGRVTGIVGVSRDVTQSKQAEEKINQLNQSLSDRAEELEAANKELEAFSYSVSHDLRAPLRAVDGFSRILLEDYSADLPDDARRYLGLVREGAQQMGRLIDDLLSFSRLGRQPLKRQVVSLRDLAEQILSELAGEKDGRQLEIILGDLPLCEADPSLLKQVIANLLANAMKFTRKSEMARIEMGCNVVDGESVYFVKDNGAGFDMQYSDKLFGVFQRLHRVEEYEGTGVGLATVQRIIHRHGGRIWADAEVDRGATFYFTLGKAVANDRKPD